MATISLDNKKPERSTKEEFAIQYNKDIEDAENDIRAGHTISREELEKESETW
jgi:hypothetical protein